MFVDKSIKDRENLKIGKMNCLKIQSPGGDKKRINPAYG